MVKSDEAMGMATARLREILLSTVRELPDECVDEVVDFMQFLLWRRRVPETAALSEASLAVAWLSPEEDEAWKSL